MVAFIYQTILLAFIVVAGVDCVSVTTSNSIVSDCVNDDAYLTNGVTLILECIYTLAAGETYVYAQIYYEEATSIALYTSTTEGTGSLDAAFDGRASFNVDGSTITVTIDSYDNTLDASDYVCAVSGGGTAELSAFDLPALSVLPDAISLDVSVSGSGVEASVTLASTARPTITFDEGNPVCQDDGTTVTCTEAYDSNTAVVVDACVGSLSATETVQFRGPTTESHTIPTTVVTEIPTTEGHKTGGPDTTTASPDPQDSEEDDSENDDQVVVIVLSVTGGVIALSVVSAFVFICVRHSGGSKPVAGKPRGTSGTNFHYRSSRSFGDVISSADYVTPGSAYAHSYAYAQPPVDYVTAQRPDGQLYHTQNLGRENYGYRIQPENDYGTRRGAYQMPARAKAYGYSAQRPAYGYAAPANVYYG